MKIIIIILLSVLSFNLKAQELKSEFEESCLTDTIWVTINPTPHLSYDDALKNALNLNHIICSYEILENIQGYWISCKVVRNPKYSNYNYWLKNGKLSSRINKKGLIFIY